MKKNKKFMMLDGFFIFICKCKIIRRIVLP